MRRKKIGILGGTFDPPHIAHLIIAQEALKQLRLDQVWFIPCYIPPHKRADRISSPKHRLQMLKLAVLNNPEFRVSDLELRRKGISYTVDTLREIGLQWPQTALYLILGSDNLRFLSGWKKPEEIFSLAKVVLAKRPGSELGRANVWVKKSVLIEAPLLEISSSQIREKVRRGEKISFWVPERVEKYIEKHRLYKK